MIKIAILGYGTVGSGVYDVIVRNQDVVSEKAGEGIEVAYVLDLRDFPGDPAESVLTHDFEDILKDDEVKIVVETMGGVEPANTFVRKAINAGKSVCTSNKELVAKYGSEILEEARKNSVTFLYEASVGGGIPVLRAMNESLTADHFDKISGILNGTTNYILTRMDKEGAAFDAVLKDAQDKGYAERKPEADIEGYDACRKIAILASLMTGSFVDYEDISTEGITKISGNDFKWAAAAGMSIKLLGIAKQEDDKFFALVAPFMVEENDPLYAVNGVYNAILLHGDMLEDVMFYGQGAGKHATASAVVSDVVELARNLGKCLDFGWAPEKKTLTDTDAYETPMFVRIKSSDTFSLPAGAFNIEGSDLPEGEIAFITEVMKKSELMKLLGNEEVLQIIRVNR